MLRKLNAAVLHIDPNKHIIPCHQVMSDLIQKIHNSEMKPIVTPRWPTGLQLNPPNSVSTLSHCSELLQLPHSNPFIFSPPRKHLTVFQY